MKKSADAKGKKDFILWNNFRNGDEQAFAKIYRDYYPMLMSYGLKIKRDESFIEDCIQETFYDIFTHSRSIGKTDNIMFYLFASLRRKIFRKLRYDVSFNWEPEFYMNNHHLSEGSSEDQVIKDENQNEKKELIRNLINRLPARQKEALLMKFYLHFEYTDIAYLMELNLQSVRNLIHRAIKSLREDIKSHHK